MESNARINVENKHLHNSFTIVAYRDGETIARSTVYLLDYNLYQDIYFWRVGPNEGILEKVYLLELGYNVEDICIIFAYTQAIDEVRFAEKLSSKAHIVSFYLKLSKAILEKGCFGYLEPTGIGFLTEEQREKEQLILGKDVEKELLGKVYEESKTAYRIAEALKMKKAENLYHSITLGCIFLSKNIEGE